MLLQDDDFSVANDWFSLIEHVIVTLSQRELVGRNSVRGVGRSSLAAAESGAEGGGTESASSTLQSKKSKVRKNGR